MRVLLDSDEFDFRYDIGVSQPSHTLQLSDRDRILNSMATHYAVKYMKAEVDQLKEGLKAMGVLDVIVSNPRKMRPLFVHHEPATVHLTADKMIDLFTPVLSPVGSNQRELEEAVMMHWVNYIQMIESKSLCDL